MPENTIPAMLHAIGLGVTTLEMDIVFTITIAVLVALTIGVTAFAKQLGMPTKFAPLVAVVFAILATLGLSMFEASTTVILTGLMVGLSACGLYSGTKAVAGN